MCICQRRGRSTGGGAIGLASWAVSAATLAMAGCSTPPQAQPGPLTHQPTFQPGLLAAVEMPDIADWALQGRSNHHLNPRRSESSYLEEQTVVRQHQRMWTSNGKPRESSSFSTWTWQFGAAPR